MQKKYLSLLLAAAMGVGLAAPVSAWGPGFADDGGYSETTIEYTFLTEESALVYGKQVELDFTYLDMVFSGSDLYVPIGATDTSEDEEEEVIATDKMIKNDNVQLSYKVITGMDYVDNVTLVSGKKEKLKDLPAGMYAKIELADTFLPLSKSRVSVRLVLSVNGVSFQDTAITYNCDLQNRIEEISKNSVYGALVPAQFKVSSSYFGDATFDFGSNIKYTARVSGGRKYYVNLDKTPNASLESMYPDVYMEFYDFRGNNDTFTTVGTLEIPVNTTKFKAKKTRAEVYAYEIVGNTLTALSLDDIGYNARTNKISLRAKTLGSYVLSGQALMKDVTESNEHDILRSGYAENLLDESATDINESSGSSSSSTRG